MSRYVRTLTVESVARVEPVHGPTLDTPYELRVGADDDATSIIFRVSIGEADRWNIGDPVMIRIDHEAT